MLTRLVAVAGGDGYTFVLLEDVIRAHIAQLFPGQTIVETTVIRLARDAELELDDEGGRTHLEVVEREVRRRRRSDVVRLEVEAAASEELLALLRDQLDISPRGGLRGPGSARSARAVRADRAARVRRAARAAAAAGRRPRRARADQRVRGARRSRRAAAPPLRRLRSGDRASSRRRPTTPTCSRSSRRSIAPASGSPIIAALQRAAERNKQVTVLVELTARFDEERNIQWARALEQAGAHVIYGVRRYKTHAKICLVVQADAARAAALRASRHRQLQRADRAGLHRLRA